MTEILTIYLLITGIGGSIALAMPSLVILGLFLFLLPGLILGAMPTLFMYGVAFTGGWAAGRALFGDGLPAVACGFAAVIAVGVLIPRPTRVADLQAYRASILPDVTPEGMIELTGNILLDMPRFDLNKQEKPTHLYVPGSWGFACDSYCIAALFTPGVTSVTLVTGDKVSSESRTYRLEKRPACQSNVDVSEAALISPIMRTDATGPHGYEAKKIIASQRALQLGGEYCLVMSEPLAKHDFTISKRSIRGRSPKQWSFGPGRIDTETLEIHARDTLLYRNHQSTLRTLGLPLGMVPEGAPENPHFDWARKTIHSKKGHGAIDMARDLGRYTNLDRQSDAVAEKARDALIPAYRAQLTAALDDETLTADSVEFKVMEAYLKAIGQSPMPEDLVILQRLVADTRFTRYAGAWALHFTAEQMKPVYDAYTRRLLAHGAPPRPEQTLIGKAVQNMGAEAINLIGPLQEQMLVDPRKRMAVPELARALGYGDPDNATRLFTMLKEAAAAVGEIDGQRSARTIAGRGWQYERDDLINLISGIKSGFCLLGAKASFIRDDLDIFLKSGAMPGHLVGGHAMSDWQVILVRMGKPLSAVEKPDNIGGRVSSYQRDIQNKVARWTAERC